VHVAGRPAGVDRLDVAAGGRHGVGRHLRGGLADVGDRILLLRAVRRLGDQHVGGRHVRALGARPRAPGDVERRLAVEEAGVGVDHAEGHAVLAARHEDGAGEAHLGAAADLVGQRLQRLPARLGELPRLRVARRANLLLEPAGDLGDRVGGRVGAPVPVPATAPRAGQHQGREACKHAGPAHAYGWPATAPGTPVLVE
jgi:hypothetical protein